MLNDRISRVIALYVFNFLNDTDQGPNSILTNNFDASGKQYFLKMAD